MNPMLLFFLSLLIPTLLGAILVLPTYGAILLSLYLKYGGAILEHQFQFFYVMESYGQLVTFWSNNIGSLGIIEFILPVFGPPLVGIVLTVFLAYKFVSYVVNLFRLTTG